MYLLAFYVTEEHASQVKDAVFKAGGGRIGNYAACSWETLGQGQFMPLPGSRPFLGATGELERVSELKVELVVEDALLSACIVALKQAHPYETPAYHAIKLADV